MRLVDLEPQFVRREIRPCAGRGDDPDCHTVSPHTEHEWHLDCALTEADGVRFLCPVCFAAHPDKVGVHGVICWRPRVPLDVKPGPGRWEFSGTGLADLTLTAGSSSILLESDCNAHFFIRAGEIKF